MEFRRVLFRSSLGRPLGAPMVAAGAAMLGLAAWQRMRGTSGAVVSEGEPIAPFSLSTALGFGAFLGLMAVLTQASEAWLGDPGLYSLATLSGLADVRSEERRVGNEWVRT